MGALLSSMAASMIGLALPSISADLAIPLDQAEWIMLSFLLAVTVMLLVAGRLSDLLGHRQVFVAGYFLFGLTSLLCGLAQDFFFLVAARLLQGISGAMIMATGVALLTTSFPADRRGWALGMISTATYAGLTAGPSLGGALIAAFGWRAIFLINLPISAALIVLSIVFLPYVRPPKKFSLDIGGLILLMTSLPLVMLALSRGQQWGWHSWPTLASGAVGALLLAGFIRTELKIPEPLLDLSLFRSRIFTGAAFSALFNYVSLFIPTFLLPYYLTEGRHIPYSQAGLILAAQPIAMALIAGISGRLSDRIGTRPLAVAGLIILGLGLFGLSTVGPQTIRAVTATWLAVIGLGTGIFVSPNSSSLMGAAPRHEQGVAAGVLAVARNTGMMLGITSATVLFHAAGGRVGGDWSAAEFAALRIAFVAAACISLVGASTSALRGK